MKNQLSEITKFLSNKTVEKLIIEEISLYHVKEIKVKIISGKETLKITANYCTSFCGSLKEWINPSLEFKEDKELLSVQRNIYEKVYSLKDKKSGHYIKFKNIYLYDSHKKIVHSLSNTKNKISNINLKKFNDLLLNFKNNRVVIGNSNIEVLILLLEENNIIDFTNPETYSNKKSLKIECISPIFFGGSLLNNLTSELYLEIKENKYFLRDISENYEVLCEDIKMTIIN